MIFVVFAVGLGGVFRRTLRIIHKDKRSTNEESKTLVTSASGENSVAAKFADTAEAKSSFLDEGFMAL